MAELTHELPNAAPVRCSACRADLREPEPGGWPTCDACGVTTVRCRACGREQAAPEPGGRQRCVGHSGRGCGVWLPANVERLTHGIRSVQRTRRYPADLLTTADDLRESVIVRQGGRIERDGTVTGLDPLVAGRIRLLVDAEVLRLMNKREVIRHGVDTRAGAKAHDRMLACIDRWLRIANELPAPEEGPPTLEAWFEALEQPQEPHGAPRGEASGAGIAPEIARGTVEP